MRAEELTAEFGIAGVLDFVETEHGLVKAAISLDGVTGELYLQGAQVTAWRVARERAPARPSFATRSCQLDAAGTRVVSRPRSIVARSADPTERPIARGAACGGNLSLPRNKPVSFSASSGLRAWNVLLYLPNLCLRVFLCPEEK